MRTPRLLSSLPGLPCSGIFPAQSEGSRISAECLRLSCLLTPELLELPPEPDGGRLVHCRGKGTGEV